MKKNDKPKIMIISSVHRWDDTRIFHRQAISLSKNFDVELHACADFKSKEVNGVRVYGIPKWNRKIDRIKNWIILFFRILRSPAKVVHFHDPELVPIGFVIKKITRKKVIYDVHEQVISDISTKTWIPSFLRPVVLRIFLTIEKISVSSFDAIVYTTRIVGERYHEMSKNAVSIENYSSINTFSDLEIDFKKNKNKLIFLGRIQISRGIDRIINALKIVVEKIPDVEFVVVGDFFSEAYEEKLKSLTQQLGLEKNIRFTGFVPHLETLNFLQNASCGIVTFVRTDITTACLPNKLFEYMASGLPRYRFRLRTGTKRLFWAPIVEW